MAKKLGLGLLGVVILGVLSLYIWFWGHPVGINNYVNKATGRIVLDSPEMLTSMGIIDNSLFDHHSGRLDSYTPEARDKILKTLREGREGLDKYGPDGLSGEERLTYEITQ